ncbi:TPA: SAM-dependent methyltransferase TehB [Neisseria meningitidis]
MKERIVGQSGELFCFGQMPVWKAENLPEILLSGYSSEGGEWVCLNVLQGDVEVRAPDGSAEVWSADGGDCVFAPQQVFSVKPKTDDAEIRLSLYCAAADYFHKKYGMSATHSAVAAAQDTVPAGRALDMGCGQGRNALFLGLKGFEVTAVDHNPAALANVAELAEAEGLNVRTLEYDLNAAALQGEFDYIVATVVLMFLMPQRVPDVIVDMQAHTAAGGYNLIVSAMDTADFPCPMPFPFKFKEGELKDYYRDWELVEYKEELGAMHAKDENGNPIRFKFVTMLAKKPE